MRIVIHAWRDLAHPQAGGSEQLVHLIAGGMTDRGHDVHLICGDPVGERSYAVSASGGTYSQYARVPLLDHRLARSADVVLDVANGATYGTPLWRRGATILLVHHLHTTQWRETFPWPIAMLGTLFERRLVPVIYRRCLVLAVSRSTAQDLEGIGVPTNRIRLIQNAVGPTPATGAQRSSEPLFVALGRLVPHKRMDLLLAMWEHVRPVTGGRLVIIGDGPSRDQLRATAGPQVELVGWVDEEEKYRLLAQAWLLLHTASHEGWGIAISEAGAVGTPAIGFDVPGVRDALVDGQTGRLAKDPDEFERLWIELAQDERHRADYGDAARAVTATHDATTTVDRFEEIALEATKRSKRPRTDRSQA